MSSTERLIAPGAALLVLLGACHRDATIPPPPDAPAAAITIQLQSSPRATAAHNRIAVWITAQAPTPSGVDLVGIQGRLTFDPARLRFLGQPLDGDALVLVNAADSGRGILRVASLRAAGLASRTAELAFEVRRDDYLTALGYQPEEAVDARIRRLDTRVQDGVVERPDSPSSVVPRLLTLADWAGHLGFAMPTPFPASRVPGQGVVYGDVTLDGFILINDAAAVANLAVGNRELLTEATRDYVIAGNVNPANLPGLGEATDAIPPGRDAAGSYTITIADASVIAREAVGDDQPVVGEPIPGRVPVSERVIVADTIDSTRTFFRDSIYELHGTVVVGPGATLTIEPGTRIEGDQTTRGALVVGIGGNLIARGTRLEPIVFTCTAAVKAPGCWGGVAIAGLAPLNNGAIVAGHVECPIKSHPAIPGDYGGCLAQDSSGVLRYVRIEYGGMAPAGGLPVPALALLGVGSGTTVDTIQVHASLGDALFVSGGYVDLRALLLTAPGGDGLRWNDGWHGRAQFVLEQLIGASPGGSGLHGSNLTSGPMIGTRSDPRLSNVTVVGSSSTGAAILLDNGTAADITNAIVVGAAGPGLEIEGAEACDQANGVAMPGINVHHSVVFGNAPDYSDDADCVDEAAFGTATARANRQIDPLLRAPVNTLTPDLRPSFSSPALTGFGMPAADGFFDLNAQYIGAVPPAVMTAANIPWYAGWTRGWSGSP